MASVKPYRGGWRAHVCVGGVRESRAFPGKREAAAWASMRETELRDDQGKRPSAKYTLGDALRKYAAEVSPGKRGERWEQIRIAAMLRFDALPIAKPIGESTTAAMAAFRDARLAQVSAGTVLRELVLLAAIFEAARREWGWIAANPIHDLRKPRSPDHRSRVISQSEIRCMVRALSGARGSCKSASQSASRAFLLALRTGMRAGEVCALRWDQVRPDCLVAVGTKTGARDVPLTYQAARVIESMRGWDRETVFGIKAQTLDALFRRARERTGLAGFTFHDSRHTAATRLARRIDVLDLCKMFGWRDPKMAMIYYNPTASDIARRLSRPVSDRSR